MYTCTYICIVYRTNEKEKSDGRRKKSLTTSLQLRYAPWNRSFTLRRSRLPLLLFDVPLAFLSRTIKLNVFEERPLYHRARPVYNYSMTLDLRYCLTSRNMILVSNGGIIFPFYDNKSENLK